MTVTYMTAEEVSSLKVGTRVEFTDVWGVGMIAVVAPGTTGVVVSADDYEVMIRISDREVAREIAEEFGCDGDVAFTLDAYDDFPIKLVD